ncbi:TPA: hypothetical protein CPT96_08000 [Candidatus Gastranaerophilales bacterium HUM_10]|nr:MAG TPA: hypothetical protein CPT96_08000 [Candidatus Gastranaerophilales bacterium HUM_10]
MKIEYKILWLEDDISWLRVPKNRIEREIESYGFIPLINTINDCDLTKMKYNDYDLILVDYNLNCGSENRGNNILTLLRNRKILADAIFYSNTDIATLYEKVKQDKISNVSIFDRAVFNDENIDQIYEIITYYLKKDLDLNSMRGIMMSEVAKFDNKIWEILSKITDVESLIPYVRCRTKIQKTDFDNMSNEVLREKLISKNDSTAFLTSSMRSKLLKNLIKKMSKDSDVYNSSYESLKVFYDEIIKERNALAHRENLMDDDEEKFKLIRKNIIKHKKSFDELIKLL